MVVTGYVIFGEGTDKPCQFGSGRMMTRPATGVLAALVRLFTIGFGFPGSIG